MAREDAANHVFLDFNVERQGHLLSDSRTAWDYVHFGSWIYEGPAVSKFAAAIQDQHLVVEEK